MLSYCGKLAVCAYIKCCTPWTNTMCVNISMKLKKIKPNIDLPKLVFDSTAR